MPVYNFFCTKCATSSKKLYSVEEFQKNINCTPCPKCNYTAFHMPRAATSQTMEVIDNGLMPKAIERIDDAQRIFKEREYAWDRMQSNNTENEDE